MAEDGDHGFQFSIARCAGELEQTVFSDEAFAGPSPIANKIDATRSTGQGGLGQFKPQLGLQELNDASLKLKPLIAIEVEEDEVIHVATIALHLQLAFDEMIQWVQVNQRV